MGNNNLEKLARGQGTTQEDNSPSGEVLLMLLNRFNRPPNLHDLFHIAAFGGICKIVLGNSDTVDDLIGEDGYVRNVDSLPEEFRAFVQSQKFKSLTSTEVDENFGRYLEFLKAFEGRSLEDIRFYNKLFTSLGDSLVRVINQGSPEDIRRQCVLTSVGSRILGSLFFQESRIKSRLNSYLLGIDYTGVIHRKPLPQPVNSGSEEVGKWIDDILDIAFNAVTFYRMDPFLLNQLVDGPERWTYKNSSLRYPDLGGQGFNIGDQLFRFGKDHKVYFSPQPHEVVLRVGSIDTITVIDVPDMGGVVYKIKHTDRKITVGSIFPDDQHHVLVPSDFFPAMWLGASKMNYAEYGNVFGLVGAIARDMFVCEDKNALYKVRGPPKAQRNEKKRSDQTIRWLPRFRIVNDDERPTYDRSELEERVFEVSPHYVTGHPRKVNNPNPKQLELAKVYGIEVPVGYTFVKPHDRGGYTETRTLYKSRSALQTIFGSPVS